MAPYYPIKTVGLRKALAIELEDMKNHGFNLLGAYTNKAFIRLDFDADFDDSEKRDTSPAIRFLTTPDRRTWYVKFLNEYNCYSEEQLPIIRKMLIALNNHPYVYNEFVKEAFKKHTERED